MADASPQRPAPSATGTLASRPLLHLLIYARNRRLSGKLELRVGDDRHGAIELWRGRICGARTAPPVAYFGTVAYELGCIDTSTLDATLLEISKSKRLHGEVLVERGAITAAQRDEILAEQACRKIHHLFALPPESTFSFYDERPGTEEPPLMLDPLKPAWRGLRDHPPMDSVREVLDRYASIPLRLTSESPITSTAFSPEESALCEALSSRSMTIDQMRKSASAALPSSRVELLAYLLVIAKCADPAPASTPSMPAVRAAVPGAPISTPRIQVGPFSSGSMPSMPRTVFTPGGPARPDSRTMRAANMAALDSGERRVSLSFQVGQVSSNGPASSSRCVVPPTLPIFSPTELGPAGIAHRAQSLDSEDFFEALGLPDEASADAARAAYFRLAKLWHPDRLPADLEPFHAECEAIFTHMTRASATLTDADARQKYIETRDQDAAASTIAAKPRKDVIRDIDTSLGKRDFLVAEQTARHLMSLDKDDAEAQALAAWAQIQGGEAPEELLRNALPELDKAVHEDTYCERAHYYRGVVHKRLGSAAAAFRDFTRVTQINPKHVDAQREIRIFEMRARKGSGEHKLDALISKTKKK